PASTNSPVRSSSPCALLRTQSCLCWCNACSTRSSLAPISKGPLPTGGRITRECELFVPPFQGSHPFSSLPTPPPSHSLAPGWARLLTGLPALTLPNVESVSLHTMLRMNPPCGGSC